VGQAKLLVCAAAVVAFAACHPPGVTDGSTTPARPKMRMRAFTETSPVRLIATAGSYVFAAKTHGLERWSPDGEVLPLSAAHGLPGDRVLGLATDASRGWLWIVTEGGVAAYETASETLRELPPSPIVAELGIGGNPAATPSKVVVAAASDGGLWLGHPRGLYYATPSGTWNPTPITDPITALLLGADGWLWIGTDRGLIGRRPDGKSFTLGPEQGNEVVTTRLIAPAPGGGVLVVGEDAGGRQRVAIGAGTAWTSYKVSPNVRWSDVTVVGDHLAVITDTGLYLVSARKPGLHRPLSRDGSRLMPLAGGAPEPLRIDRLDARLPPGATGLGARGQELLIATRELGVARYALDATRPVGWLRRAEMLATANTLTVHCVTKEDCWLATGAPRAWRWRGDAFEPAGPEDDVVLALVRSTDGVLYGLHRKPNARAIDVARIDGEAWTSIGVTLTTPGVRPEVSFARFAPSGELWVGLRYHERDDPQAQPWGVAIIDVELGAVAYHHATDDAREVKRGVLPVPVTVVDAAFLGNDEVWMASLEGAVRLKGDAVTVWNEGMQLESELLSAVAVSAGGLVFVATPSGVGTYDGERWRFPPELGWTVNDLALARDSRLWLATERGIAIFDGRKVRRMDVRRGLVENLILDITIDEFGRVWARGPSSLALITP